MSIMSKNYKLPYLLITFWITVLYKLQYLFLSISYISVLFRHLLPLQLKQKISTSNFLSMLVFQIPSWPRTPDQQTKVLIDNHHLFTQEMYVFIAFLFLLNLYIIINFWWYHDSLYFSNSYERRYKKLSKEEADRRDRILEFTWAFVITLILITFIFYYNVPNFDYLKIFDTYNSSPACYVFVKLLIAPRVSYFKCWMGSLILMLLIVIFVSWRTGTGILAFEDNTV